MKIFAIQQGDYSSRKNPSQKKIVHGEKKATSMNIDFSL